MPIYCYTTDDGVTVDRTFQMGKAPEEVVLENGKIAKRDLAAQLQGGPRSGSKGEWPIVCCASGVHADQSQELRDHFKDHGCPTEVTGDGDPVYRDHQHRKKALKCRGLHDRASFGT